MRSLAASSPDSAKRLFLTADMFSPAGFGQTVAVIDQSGKVVSSVRSHIPHLPSLHLLTSAQGKHLLNLFKEAKYAYQDRKAELASAKRRAPVRAHTFADNRSVASSSHRSQRSRRPREYEDRRDGPRRGTTHRRHSDDVRPRSARAAPPPASPTLVDGPAPDPPRSPARSPYSPHAPGAAPAPATSYFPAGDLALRPKTALARPAAPARSHTTGHIDMDLAYGDLPPSPPFRGAAPPETELRGLVGRAHGLLQEADCLKASATHIIATLQRNPDAMAAVALTLAEISKLVKGMAPGALVVVRRLSPAIFSLLVSPQFLIAAGVGVGLTVIALGGFKVVKKIQAGKMGAGAEREEEMVRALPAEVSRIETWRRGIADVESGSTGTSVEGEFITPEAARLSRLNLDESPREVARPAYPMPARTQTVASVRTASSRGSKRSEGSGREKRSGGERKEKGRKETTKSTPKRPSPLRALFSI